MGETRGDRGESVCLCAGLVLFVGQRLEMRSQRGRLHPNSSLADTFMSSERGILTICFLSIGPDCLLHRSSCFVN